MTDRQYGGFWRRSFAFLIDMAMVYLVSQILFFISLLSLGMRGDLMGRIMDSPPELTHGLGTVALLYLTAHLLAGITYFTWFHGIRGQTPGKKLFGLCVIQVSGDPMTLGIAFLRWTGYLISGLIFFLGFLWIALDGRKQGWHDKIAATLVVREKGERDRDARRDRTQNAADTPEVPAGVEGLPPSAGTQDDSLPSPEEQPDRPCTDRVSPGQ